MPSYNPEIVEILCYTYFINNCTSCHDEKLNERCGKLVTYKKLVANLLQHIQVTWSIECNEFASYVLP